MPRKGANVTLSSYDEIFTTEESRTESQQEHVQMIPLSELHPFEGHPFRVVDDEEMQKTVESVKQYGVMTRIRTAVMRLFLATAGFGRPNWPDWISCRSLSGRWMMILQSFLWWTATCKESISCRVSGRLPTR